MRRKNIKQKVFIYIAVAFLFVYIVAPLAWMFISSISNTKDLLTTNGQLISNDLTFERYNSIFSNEKIMVNGVDMSSTTKMYMHAVLNSTIVAGLTTIISLFIGSIAAYAFARLKFLLRKTMFFLVMFLQMLPPIALILPYYMIVRKLGVIDQLGTLIVIYTSFILAYAIWIFYGYFKALPKDLESAALIDGCSYFSSFWRIIFPNSLPGFVAVGALSFLLSWDEFMYALIFTNTDASKTIPIAVSEFSTKFGADYGLTMTGGIIATIIPMILAVIFQRYIITGLTIGSIKE